MNSIYLIFSINTLSTLQLKTITKKEKKKRQINTLILSESINHHTNKLEQITQEWNDIEKRRKKMLNDLESVEKWQIRKETEIESKIRKQISHTHT